MERISRMAASGSRGTTGLIGAFQGEGAEGRSGRMEETTRASVSSRRTQGKERWMTVRELEPRLRAALAGALPGAQAHALLAPRPRPGWSPGRLPGESRLGAGLVL